MRDLSSLWKKITFVFLVACSCFHLYTAIFGVLTTLLQRSIHLAFLVPLAFIYYPATSRSPRHRPSFFDGMLAILALVSELLIIVEMPRILMRLEHLTPLLARELFLGTLIIVLVLEATRRSVSPILALIAACSLLYLLLGHWAIFGIFQHPRIPYQRIIEQMYLLGEQGVHGVVVGVSASYVFLFILFGAFLINTDVGNFMIDFASSLFGRRMGGPAKVAVTSSCLFGMISGSGPANVYATGSFTIPLMKKLGYSPSFAAAVEAAASTGGQYMPPVMGAVAFIIAETTGTAYYEVCKQAALSAFLYYFAIYMVVHFEAKKLNLGAIPKSDLKDFKYIIKRIYLFLPIIVILVLIGLQYTPLLAGVIAIGICFGLSFLRKDTMMLPKRLVNTLATGAQNAIMIAIACACVGLIAGTVIYTGIGLRLTSIIIQLGGYHLFVAPFLTMVICLMLGMGVPCVPAYVVTAVITLPILNKLGFTGLGPHLFIFYYAIIASLTPPVAVSAYAAASIANAEPVKTSLQASSLAFVGFIVPFLFLFNKSLLLQGPLVDIFKYSGFAIITTICWSIGMVGYIRKKLSLVERVGLFLIGLFFVYQIIS